MRKLISVFGSPEAVLGASIRDLMDTDGVDKTLAEKIRHHVNESFVTEQLASIVKYKVRLLTYWDKEYPERLKSIYDPPPFLFTRGDLSVLKEPAFAIVGSRTPTNYGKMVTEKIAGELVKSGLVIISGFARGIDTAAHKAALKNGGKTIAVLGNGVDLIYPAGNRDLYEQVLDNGVFLSEYPMGTNPDPGNFPKRNRLISGVSYGVMVSEAAAKSGALLTAMYGLDQNRDIFAVPGAIISEKSQGTNKLIKDGAKLVDSVEDILEELKSQLSIDVGNIKVKEKKLPKLSAAEKKIFEMLSAEPLHIDQIAFKGGFSTSETLGVLLSLELFGLVRQMAGKMFIRIL
jgi:DNA processing protein